MRGAAAVGPVLLTSEPVAPRDIAADDCFALLIGVLDPRADLRAVTMVAGNVGSDQQLHDAFLTIALAGRAGEAPVHLGARTPLLRLWMSATGVHGDGVVGQPPSSPGRASRISAS